MINLLPYVQHLQPVKVKHPVPQVGSRRIFYETTDHTIITNIQDVVDYVVTMDGDLLLGKGHYKLNNKAPYLFMAGKLAVVDGKIGYLDNDSGHYEPGVQLFRDFLNAIATNPYIRFPKIRKFLY